MCKPPTPKFDGGHAADLSVIKKKRPRPLLLSISIVALSIIIGVIINSLSTFEGGPHDDARPIPPEAVPIWRTTELHWFVRYFMGYLWGALAPVATMTACPTLIDMSDSVEVEAAQTCMKRGRAMEDMDLVDLESMFDVQDIFIDRPAGGDPLRVTLLKKQKQNTIADSTMKNDKNSKSSKAISPLILFIHGGGFVVRGVKKTMSSQIFNELLKLDSSNDENEQKMMEDATFALVEYRLAPEHVYPAATNDCILALNHLVHKMKLGKGGVHVAGSSAGATLTMETTLKNLDIVDTFYVDEPVVVFPRTKNNDNKRKVVEWTMDSASVRRYSYTRMPPVAWLEWALKAYTGKQTVSGMEDNLPLGTVSTNVDITGGAMAVSEWTKKRKKNGNKKRGLPRLILVTAMGDPLLDGGLAFKKVYENALIKEKEEVKDSSGVLKAKHFDTYSGHASFYLFETQLFQRIMKEWYNDMTDVWISKSK